MTTYQTSVMSQRCRCDVMIASQTRQLMTFGFSLRLPPPGSVRVRHCTSDQDWRQGAVSVSISLCPPQSHITGHAHHQRQGQKQKRNSGRRALFARDSVQSEQKAELHECRGGALLQCDSIRSWAPFVASAQQSACCPRRHHGVVGGVRTKTLSANKRHWLLLHRKGVWHGGHICRH